MKQRNQRTWQTPAWFILCAAILCASCGCASQRSWDDTRPGPSGPDLADVGGVIVGLGYAVLYAFAHGASDGSGAFDQYSYNARGWR